MSHDPSPAWTARNHDTTPPGHAELHDNDAALNPGAALDNDGESASRSRSRSTSRRRRKKKSKKKRNPGLVKKLAFITHLLRTLDLVVFAELSALYYMECSMFRFLLRSAGQYMYLTPKDESFPFLMPASRIHVLLIVIPNIICMLLHLLGSPPVGPDFHRGYQHGGLIIDFIGQRPPTYRLYYLLADVVILAAQCLMLTVHTQREKLRVTLKTFRPLLPELVQEMATARSSEDLDAEERGVLRDAPDTTLDGTEGIALGSMAASQGGGDQGSGQAGESESLLRENSNDDNPRTHLSDIMASGNAVLSEYHVVQSTISAAINLERTTAHSLHTIGYGATLAALQARRRGAAAQARSQRPDI
ncbi:DSC E3 ubiquitin ligase complex subunit 4 [Tolypocladium capitatum]|uniref:DSC E3 ubiquitin ligase complex subunit 4 n=1 Tax=Tolypocladium capitatum TaxID=45235 RepID=A0A2K3Q826_9HYPO|nr:DSC E3 ubiquitin ligase complex subunit 4 [Tolypocladium capitatum]